MAKIKPLTGNMLPVVIATGGYTLQAPGMTGSVKSLSNQESATRSDSGHHAEHLLQALQGSEIDSQKILEFEVKDDAVRASGLTARAGELTAVTRDGEPAIILRAPILEEKAEQAVLYTDEAGVSRWIFPEAVEDKSVQASRGAGPEAVFHLPRRSAPLPQNVTTDENANRGPLAVLGRRMVHLLTWATDDIVGKGAVYVAEQWESRRRPYALRSFPEMESASQDSIDWGRISKGRALLFIHGTFSTASSAFAELPKSTLDSLSQLYEGRLLAFNHPSLSVSPEQNAQAFIDLLPDEVDLKLDVVTHSRGGLVGRELIERFAQLHAAGRKLKVERAVMVAAPQRGTILTDEDHGIALIDRFTNLLTKLPDNAYTLTVEGVLMLVKLLAHGALKGLPGLRSMYPGGEYLKRLNSVPLHTTRYFAVGAQFVPSLPALRERFGKYIGEKFLDEVFGEASDGVVPTLGSYDNGAASALFPISNDHRLIFDQSAGIHHCNYFGNERLNGELIKWLEAVKALVNAQSPGEMKAVFDRHPELLNESSINRVLGIAVAASSEGDGERAEALKRIAQFMSASLNRGEGPESEADEVASSEPISSEPSVAWARLTRQYLALRRKEYLEQAIIEASKAGEEKVLALLQAFQERNNHELERVTPPLYEFFQKEGRNEEASTVALVVLDPQALLAEQFPDFPVDKQVQALEIGLQACCEASATSKELSDGACQAFYKVVEGGGYERSQRPEAAEQAFVEGLQIYRKLAEEQSQVYQFYVAGTLNNLGNVLGEQHRLEEAEKAFVEGLEIYRKLAEEQPHIYEPKTALTLNNLGKVLGEQRRLKEAEKAFVEGLKIYRKLAEKQPHIYQPNVAWTLNNLGSVLEDLRRLGEAEKVIVEGLAIYRDLAEKLPHIYEPDVAGALNSLGNVLTDERRLEEAEKTFLEGLEIYGRLAEKLPDDYQPDVARTLDNLGNALREQHRLEEAEQAFVEGLEINRRLGKKQPQIYEPNIARSLNNLGNVLREQHRLEEAQKAFAEGLEIRRKLAKKQQHAYQPVVAGTLNNLGLLLREQRRLEEAETAFEEGLAIYRSLAEKQPEVYEPDVATTLNNLGNVRREQHQMEGAEKAFEEGLECYRRLAEKQPQVYKPDVAWTLNNLGLVLMDQRRLKEAEDKLVEGLAIRRKLAEEEPQVYEPNVAGTLNSIGSVLADERRLEEAEDAFVKGLEIYRRLAEKQPQVYQPNVVVMLNNLGNVLGQHLRLEEAEKAFVEGVELCRHHDLPAERTLVLSGLGQVYQAKSKWREAADAMAEAADQVERLRVEAITLDRRMRILRENMDIYESLLICLMKLGRYEEALEVAERGKSRTLNDLLTMRDMRPRNTPPEMTREYEQLLFHARALQDQLQRGDLEIAGARNLPPEEQVRRREEQIKSLQNERRRTNGRLHELVGEIRQHDPDFLPHAKPLTLAEIKQLATDVGSTLALFRVTRAGSYVFLVYPEGDSDVVEVPKFTADALSEMLVRFDGEKAVDGWVVRYYGLQDARLQAQQIKDQDERRKIVQAAWKAWLDTMDATLGDLYRWLLAPVCQRLKERASSTGKPVGRLLMVPNRGLAILPLHACWREEKGGRRYLLDDYVIHYAPSLSVFKRCLEREQDGRKNERLLGIANPVPPGNLAFSEWECGEIERLLGKGRCHFLRGQSATEKELMRLVGDYQWLHFSCHGRYRLDAPLESPLQLAGGDELQLGEILERLDLRHTWLTVLSACETGLVDFREIADEHYGLPLGFLFAGAPTVWGTLWTVDDATTALLMKLAYKNLVCNNETKPEALRNAQICLRDATAQKLSVLIKDLKLIPGDNNQKQFVLKIMDELRKGNNIPLYSHPYYWAGMQCVGV